MSIEPNNADVRHSLGYSWCASATNPGRPTCCAEPVNSPRTMRYACVYGVALNSTGASGQAMAVLDQAHRQHPTDQDVLMALVSIAHDTGDLAARQGTGRP